MNPSLIERTRLRKKFPEGTLVKLRAKAIPRPYIPKNATFRIGEIGKDHGNIFVRCEKLNVGFFVSTCDIIFEEKVIFS